jgi:hypothetical protein
MPNWCWNNVEFTGEEKNLENLSKLLDKTIEMQEKTGQGQLLFGLESSIDGYMFNISNIDSGEGWLKLSFDSRWAPIPNEIIRIAELFNLQFVCDYEEGGMSLYGKYTFEYEDVENEGVLYEQSATEEDIDSCRYKDEADDPDDPDEMSGLNLEKLESIIEHNEMHCRSITRIQETAA